MKFLCVLLGKIVDIVEFVEKVIFFRFYIIQLDSQASFRIIYLPNQSTEVID